MISADSEHFGTLLIAISRSVFILCLEHGDEDYGALDLTFSSGYFDPASSKSPRVMYRSVHTVFRKSYVSCESISSRVSSAHMGCNMGQGDHTADADLRATSFLGTVCDESSQAPRSALNFGGMSVALCGM